MQTGRFRHISSSPIRHCRLAHSPSLITIQLPRYFVYGHVNHHPAFGTSIGHPVVLFQQYVLKYVGRAGHPPPPTRERIMLRPLQEYTYHTQILALPTASASSLYHVVRGWAFTPVANAPQRFAQKCPLSFISSVTLFIIILRNVFRCLPHGCVMRYFFSLYFFPPVQ